MTLESRLCEQLQQQLESFEPSINRLVLAFSGGLDSCVLLHLLAQHAADFRLTIWHINHGLLDCAKEMETFCSETAKSYQLELKLSHLNLKDCTSNVEALARTARYAEFESQLNDTDVLLTAHHADDQTETFFLNLLRGAGSAGLRGIARNKQLGRSQMLRPLLDFERTGLAEYADLHHLEWFDDPSNIETRFNRNYLRNRILPLIKDRWPGYLRSIQSACFIQSETQQLLDEFAEIDYDNCKLESPGQLDRLCQGKILGLSKARQKNLIRFWLRRNHCASLPGKRLEELIKQLTASKDARPLVKASDYDTCVYAQQLFIVPHQAELSLALSYQLNDSSSLDIESIGMNISRVNVFDLLNIEDQGQSLRICFNLEEAELKISKHRLKRLFQKHRIPPWLRRRTPLIVLDGELKDIWR